MGSFRVGVFETLVGIGVCLTLSVGLKKIGKDICTTLLYT